MIPIPHSTACYLTFMTRLSCSTICACLESSWLDLDSSPRRTP